MEEEKQAGNWKPKGGRPKVRDEERRDQTFKIRLNAGERKELDEQAAAAGYQDLSTFMRVKLFSQNGAAVHNPKELFHAIDKTGAALNKIGANINQIARYVHYLEKNNMVSEQVLAEYNQQCQQLIKVEDEYVKAIRAYLRTTR
ncbi:mobilization protein MobC [Pontibacter ummariensis]|uniref:Mobilisation protein (MobC) n=1 Tax=Pontibacter ummariensis TaxID=1610492 RepID=A0A239IZF2_9BACT|nr:plasmid mobilization relaxosome protein MobC [Pontibacter ummariensis]PRY09016.1 mobilization protein MobC [Pontibacter ummariensis]SNS98403.1 mobilisation protein (MobC) [Pontibacter ummariensis]